MTHGRGLVHLSTPHSGLRQMTLDAPRANALEPELLSAIRATLDQVEQEKPEALLITSGRSFCSGGDVSRFLEAARAGRAVAYAQEVVPPLQEIIHRLVALPVPVVVAARGAMTGGGAGFLFAADLAVLHPDSFLQSYYGKVGFAPDGGWTALLPEMVGAKLALNWVLTDYRASAADLVEYGIATRTDAQPEAAALALLDQSLCGTRQAAKALVWDKNRLRRLRERLDAETRSFLARIDHPDTLTAMEAFLGEREAADV